MNTANNNMSQAAANSSAAQKTKYSATRQPNSKASRPAIEEEVESNILSLRQWVEDESQSMYFMLEQNELTLRKITVAYGIVELLRTAKSSLHHASAKELQSSCNINNFGVVLAGKFNEEDEDADRIVGVEMLSPRSSLQMITPFFTRGEFFGDDSKGRLLHREWWFGLVTFSCYNILNSNRITLLIILSNSFLVIGEYLEVEITPPSITNTIPHGDDDDDDEMMLSHLVGCLLYDLLITGNTKYQSVISGNESGDEPPKKKNKLSSLSDLATNIVNARSSFFDKYTPLLELGFSSSIHLLIEELINGRVSLEVASKDLHLLVLDPRTFLFERAISAGEAAEGRPSLKVRTGKLYGRERETTFVTDSFCSVTSTGESEALLIG